MEQLDTFDPLYRAKLGGLLATDPALNRKRVELEVMIKQLLEDRYDADVFDRLCKVMKTPWYKAYQASRRQVLRAARCCNIDIEHELLLVRTLGCKRIPIDQQNPQLAYVAFVAFVTGANFLTDRPVLLPAACNHLLSDVIRNKDLKAVQEVCALMEYGALVIDPVRQKTINDMAMAEQLDRAVQQSFAAIKS
jgi:hypothetical protein